MSNSIKLAIKAGYHILSKPERKSMKINKAGRLVAAIVKRKSSQSDRMWACNLLFGVKPDCSSMNIP